VSFISPAFLTGDYLDGLTNSRQAKSMITIYRKLGEAFRLIDVEVS
jgi:hypothetical protein